MFLLNLSPPLRDRRKRASNADVEPKRRHVAVDIVVHGVDAHSNGHIIILKVELESGDAPSLNDVSDPAVQDEAAARSFHVDIYELATMMIGVCTRGTDRVETSAHNFVKVDVEPKVVMRRDAEKTIVEAVIKHWAQPAGVRPSVESEQACLGATSERRQQVAVGGSLHLVLGLLRFVWLFIIIVKIHAQTDSNAFAVRSFLQL